MASLLTEDQGLPKPQYESESGITFEAQKGKEGAKFVYVKEGHNVTLGSAADEETANTLIGLTKAKKGLLTTIKDTLALMKTKLDDVAGKSDTMRVSSAALTTGAITGAITVLVTAVELRVGGTPLANRRTVEVYNMSETEIVYLGFGGGVTTATGIPVWPKTAHKMNISTGSGLPVYAIAAASTSIRIVES
jgi:ABC-type Fe3+-hydroxamate transport system substrate-binding protein